MNLKRLVAGASCFVGLATTCMFLPMNHYASKMIAVAQDNLMKARDERMSLMNEVRLLHAFVIHLTGSMLWQVLGAIRMLKVCSNKFLWESDLH